MSTSQPVPTAKRRRTDDSQDGYQLCTDAVSVPTLTADADTGLISSEAFFEAYQKHQAVLLKSGYAERADKETALSWRGLAALFDSLTDDDQNTFCIENAAANGDGRPTSTSGNKEGKPRDFLTPSGDEERRGYCSFLVQNEETLADTLDRLPLPQLPLEISKGSSTSEKKMRHGPCLWFFFGRNASEDESLDGRPEHTDSVSHDGTWHYQLSGCKEWHIRPTAELIKRRNGKVQSNSTDPLATDGVAGMEDGRVIVKCNQGDVLILNTRLWWHKTVIPPQSMCKDDCKAVPSVSYARDVYFPEAEGSANADDSKMVMMNVDGLYAAAPIDKGTLILTEEDMPECEMHRAEDPNCELVQLESGMGAIISRRAIAAGEFFCIAESSDEEDTYEDEEEVGEEE